MLKEKLNSILQEIWNDKEFIDGVQACLETDEARQEMLDVLEDGYVKTPADIVDYAWAIYNDAPFEDEEEVQL